MKQIKHGYWKFKKGNKTLMHTYQQYEVDLERLSAVEWTKHLRGKAWMTDESLGDFILCLREIYLICPNLPVFRTMSEEDWLLLPQFRVFQEKEKFMNEPEEKRVGKWIIDLEDLV